MAQLFENADSSLNGFLVCDSRMNAVIFYGSLETFWKYIQFESSMPYQ